MDKHKIQYGLPDCFCIGSTVYNDNADIMLLCIDVSGY